MLRKVCSDSELPKELDRPAARASWASNHTLQELFSKTITGEQDTLHWSWVREVVIFFFPEEISQQPLVVIGPKVVGIWGRVILTWDFYVHLCPSIDTVTLRYLIPSVLKASGGRVGNYFFFVILDCELCKLLGNCQLSVFGWASFCYLPN